MSFFAKGDFKIEQSWDKGPEAKGPKRASSRSSNRGAAKPESLMMQRAADTSEPSTDLIDDSLSRLLLRQRGGIPTPSKKDIGDVGAKKPPQAQPRKRKQSQEDKDLLSSMASRLQKLEKTCQSQRLQMKEQRDELQKVKTENAFLKGMKEDSSKVYQEMSELRQANAQLEKKTKQMESYLQQHGLKWVGNKVSGSLDAQKIKKEIKESKYMYRLPSEIDLSTIQRRVEELNAVLQEEGRGTEIYNERGVHKFKKAEYLPIGFYANGIVVKGYNFYSYKSKQSLRILADICDGYFPFIFKARYPDGVLLQVVDKVEETYVQEKQQTSVNTYGSQEDKTFQPQSKEEFLSKLPKQVVKNGKVIQIRSQIEKIFDGGRGKGTEKPSQFVQQIDGVLYIKSSCFESVRKGEQQEADICTLKIRDEAGCVYMLQMFRHDKIADVVGEVRKVCRAKFNLMSNYPRRSYNELEDQDLEALGFFPNAHLHIQEQK